MERWGDPEKGPKIATIQRDFNRLGRAAYDMDPEKTLECWRTCERWLPFIEAEALKDEKTPTPEAPGPV